MDNNTKAKIILDAAQQTADEFRSEGKSNLADRIFSPPSRALPVGSLAKFHDILMKHSTKADALRSLGANNREGNMKTERIWGTDPATR
jgi:hypothetical protein